MAKILIIEDSPEIRENTAELLEGLHYDIITAVDGLDGINKAKESLPDLIICDVKMPKADGYEVLNTLQQDERTANIPFIFCTASAQKSDVEKGIRSGAYEYVTKPFDEEELYKVIDISLSGKPVSGTPE